MFEPWLTPCLQVPYTLLNSEFWRGLGAESKVLVVEAMASVDGTVKSKTYSKTLKKAGVFAATQVGEDYVLQIKWDVLQSYSRGYPMPVEKTPTIWAWFLQFARTCLRPLRGNMTRDLAIDMSLNDGQLDMLWRGFLATEGSPVPEDKIDIGFRARTELIRHVWRGIEIYGTGVSAIYIGLTRA